ncbi:MAG: IclR family transcriptional regulator [Kiloniellales bacterium]
MPTIQTQQPIEPRGERPGAAPAAEEGAGSTGKALRILEAVVRDGHPVSIAELSAMLHLSKPTAHRIGTALEGLGYLEREPGSRRFVEGKRLVQLALQVLQAAARRGPRHGILKALSEEIGETCNLGVMSGNEVVYLDRVEAAWPLGLRFEPGSRVPLHCTSLGKLFLSKLPEAQLEKTLTTLPLKRYTENTITARDRLLAELADIRRRGYATDNQEFMSGVVCLAVPVTGPQGGLCAGIAFSAPEARMTLEQARAQVPLLREAAEKLSETFAEEM